MSFVRTRWLWLFRARGAGLTAAPVTLAFGAAGPGSAAASGSGWTSSVSFTNQVASSPTAGGGYPVPPGQTFPNPGTCRAGALGSYRILGGTPVDNNQVQGYDCLSTGTQDMPPSWTNVTDPNAAFDTKGRVYQTTLPFNAFWGGSTLHPDGEIDVSYSDDMGRHWVKGNGGVPLEPPNNASALQLGHVEDKQWIAVNDIPGSPFQDHVYSTWDVINGKTTKIRVAVSRDRGLSFSRAITLTSPSQSGPVNSSSYPSIDAAGNVYLGYESDPVNGNGPSRDFVTRTPDDGVNWGPFVRAAAFTVHRLPNTTGRLGIPESFAASPTYPGHLYVAYEDWDGTQMDVKFTQSTDGGLTWSAPVKVNDNVDAPGQPTDQFQPEVAAAPNGAVAVAFYDRRASCPNDPSVLPADVGRTNFCIDTSLQAYKDGGSGAVPVGANVRISKLTWDPEQPGQHLGGLSQYPCAGGTDPCQKGGGFIGDYFGLAVSAQNIYALTVSTHYPSTVAADEGGPIYYQQQVLATVPRTGFGPGY